MSHALGSSPGATTGLYTPQDLIWQVNRESVLLLAGPRALLMQLAHPLVAAGVADHSDFLLDPVARLRRTLDAMLGIIYGDEAQARSSAERVNSVHRRVQGTLSRGTAAFPAGSHYRALDPALLFWVQATLIDSAVVAFECFVRALSPGERTVLYQQSKRMAPLFGLPAEALPPTWPAFRTRMQAILESETIEITPQARALAEAVLRPPLPLLPGAVSSLTKLITTALLPGSLREGYGLPWNRRRERVWRATRSALRHALVWMPDVVRTMPQARQAERRCTGYTSSPSSPRM